MKVIYNNEEFSFEQKMGVGLGNFDGLHIGHLALINTLISESRLNGLGSAVYTFIKHPENILRKKLFAPLLTTEKKKVELLDVTQLNYLYFDKFDEIFSRMKPEAFIREILVKKLNIKLAVAGFNYRFGFKGEGDAELLKEFGKKYNFETIIIPPIKIDNEVVSSTLIRHYVLKGDMDRCFKFIGRHYSITGTVMSGRRIGNTLGFPTANIHPENNMVLPYEGVYISKTSLRGRLYNSITNIGRNPTFDGIGKVTVETHILNFNGDIYGENIEVFFITKLRGEKKFKGKEELADQIVRDISKTREFFNINES